MPLGPTEVVQYQQPTALDALTKFMGARAQRQSDDQEAQDKIAQHQSDQQAAQQQQIALHLISEIGKSGGVDGINQFLTDNPQVGHYLLRPDSSADAIAHREQVRLVSTPMDDAEATTKGMKPLNATEKMERTKFIYNLKDVADRVIAAGALGGDAAAQRAASNEGGLTMSAQQTTHESELNRHNVTNEKQLAPVRGAETYRDTQQGNASRESATNQSQLRDVNSPRVQTEINKATAIVRGESTIPTRPSSNPPKSNAPGSPQWKVNDYLKRAQDLEDKSTGASNADARGRMTEAAKQLRARAEVVRRGAGLTTPLAIGAPPAVPPTTPAPTTVTHKEWRNGAWVVVNGPPPGGPVSQNMGAPSFDDTGADTEDTSGGDYAAG